MAARGSSGRILAISSLLSLVVPIVVPFGNAALARQAHATHGRTHAEAVAAQHGPGYPSTAHARGIPVYYGAAYGRAGRHARFAPRPLSFRRGGGLQCVTFARGESGIELSGNATDWWDNAAGIYQRGNRPEMGSVLNFRSNPRMRLGHVAVVTNVIDQRQIEIDQANWSGPGIYSGGVSRSIRVVDVSPANDWTAVRVELGHTEDFGSVYPTYGFIYDRADHGAQIVTASAAAAPLPVMNPAPRDLRPARERLTIAPTGNYDEVAEAPAPRGIDLSIGGITSPH